MNKFDIYKAEVIKRYLNVKFSDLDDQADNIDELYRYVRSIQNDYFINGELSDDFDYIFRYLTLAENDLPEGFIIESSPIDNFNCTCDEEEVLENIINNVRLILLKDDFSSSLINMCSYSSNLVSRNAKEIDVDVKRCVIYPGFTKEHLLLRCGSGFHAFNIVTINDKKYIVDLTYRQFFLRDRNSLERIGVCRLFNTLPGRFMIMNESRLNTAFKILKYGYVEMTDEHVKNYFDGFALSFRNATYYDEMIKTGANPKLA